MLQNQKRLRFHPEFLTSSAVTKFKPDLFNRSHFVSSTYLASYACTIHLCAL